MANPQQFAMQYGPIAAQVGQRLGVDPTILLGQWGLETGWGKSVVPGTNNLGNIKDFTGGGVGATDNMTGSRDNYRQFDTPEAFGDHFAGLIERKYPNAVGAGGDPQAFAQALKAGGYAEDPAYPNKIAAVTNTVRKQPGVMDQIAAAIFPAAQAGTLPGGNPFDQFDSPAGQVASNPFDQFDSPVDSVRTSQDGKGDSVSWVEQDSRPLAERIGGGIAEAGRQVGLTARYGLEGLGQAAQIGTEPIRQAVNPLLRMAGLPEASQTGATMSSFADTLGLPRPQGANERVVGDAARLIAGAGGIAGGAGALARGATGLTQAAMRGLAANPGQQLASAAGAGAAGGSVREAGGGPVAQAVAGLAGGLAASAALNAGQRAASAVGRHLPVIGSARPQQVEQQITLTMNRSGVDWKEVPERVRQQVREEISTALKSGDDLNGDAVRRLVDFKRIEGATPTRGTLTLDPVQLTREKNLAKSAANSSDTGLQGLARIENENNSALVRALNNQGAGAADDAVATGQRVIDQVQSGIDARKSNIGALYSAARDSQGRSFPLDGASFTQRADKALHDALLGGALPADVRNHLNKIAMGEVPFTVDYAEQLKTAMGNIQRASSDGQTRMALGVVRQALDDTPVLGLGQQTGAAGARAVNPGNLPAIPGDATIGEDAIAAFNQARAANREMMQWVESSPAIKAIYEGKAAPDNFVNKYIIGAASTSKDINVLSQAVRANPAVGDTVKANIASYLKDKALGGAADEVGNFSPSKYNGALKAIGDRKLGAFFSPEEIEQLKAIGRVGSYMKVQPAGSAVNNSNSGALLLGRGLDLLDTISSKVPLLGIGPTIQGVIRGTQQGSAQRIAPSLLNAAPRLPFSSRVGPAALYGGLLSGAAIPPGQDDRRP